MLHREAVCPDTLNLIESLQDDNNFRGFFLTGGTALALHLGHRESIDIDLFTDQDFDIEVKLEYLEKNYDFSLQYSAKNTLKGIINGINVDFITHDYPVIDQILEAGRIRLFSQPDIAAMKVNAITLDGTRIKDFIDIYFLLEDHSFSDILGYYKKKYDRRNDLHAVKSLCYFDDIDREQNWPKMLKEQNLTLDKIKDRIIQSRDQYLSGKLKI
jgi:hypothetical protein